MVTHSQYFAFSFAFFAPLRFNCFLSRAHTPKISTHMAKSKTQFLCNSCGSVHPKWMGKCPDCGTWDSLEEYKAPTFDARADGRAPSRPPTAETPPPPKPRPPPHTEHTAHARLPT